MPAGHWAGQTARCATVATGAAGAAVERSRDDDWTSAAHPARRDNGGAGRCALLKIATEREERDDGPGDQGRASERRRPHVLVVGTAERKMSRISWRRMTTSPHVGAGRRRRARRPTRQASDAPDRRRRRWPFPYAGSGRRCGSASATYSSRVRHRAALTLFGGAGRGSLRFLGDAGRMSRFLGTTLQRLPRRPFRPRLAVAQMR